MTRALRGAAFVPLLFAVACVDDSSGSLDASGALDCGSAVGPDAALIVDAGDSPWCDEEVVLPEVPAADPLDPSGEDTPEPLTIGLRAAIGLEIVDGGKVPTGADGSGDVYRFPSGVISVRSAWSADNGASWQSTPPDGYEDPGPAKDGSEAAIHLGDDEIYSPGTTLVPMGSGVFEVGGRRSTRNWLPGTVESSPATVTAPLLAELVGDEGESAGFGRIQDLIHTRDGRIMAVAYGRHGDDRTPWDTYEHVPGRFKLRVVAWFSEDRGHSWTDEVTLASRFMLTRGGNSDATAYRAVGLMQAQEGPNEAALARTAAGHIVCVMRTGHRKGASSLGLEHFQESPYYITVSQDEGRTWALPRQVRTASDTLSGGNPKLLRLGNGVLVLAGPDNRGAYLAFSLNGGATWNARSYLTTSSSDIDVARVGFSTFQAYYSDNSRDATDSYVAHTITVNRAGESDEPQMDFHPEGPWVVNAGESSRLTWWSQSIADLSIQGGAEWPSFTRVSGNLSAAVGPLGETTTYTLRDDATGVTQSVTIEVR